MPKIRNMNLTLKEFNSLPLRKRIHTCPICRGDGNFLKTSLLHPSQQHEDDCTECQGYGMFFKDRR